MNVPLSAGAIAALLASGTATIVVLLHLLPLRHARRITGSTLIWEAASRARRALSGRWRWWLAVLSSLVIASTLAFLTAYTDEDGHGFVPRKVVLVVDDSPSMAARTRDGSTRWRRAVAIARTIVADAGGEVMIVDTMGQVAGSSFLAGRDALAQLDRLDVVAAGDPYVPDFPEGPDVDVHVVSDGVAAFRIPRQAIVHPVFERADNVAVASVVARVVPGDPLRVDALVQVVNGSLARKSVRIALRGDGGATAADTIAMEPGETVDAVFDVSTFPSGVLAAAAFTPGDAVPSDDIAFTRVPVHGARRVVLVTRGNAALADALASLPAVRLVTVGPGSVAGAGRADVLVFDGVAPTAPPDVPALIIGASGAGWLPAPDGHFDALDLRDAGSHSPRAKEVPWGDARVRHGSAWSPRIRGVRPWLTVGDQAIVVSGDATARWMATGFALGESDLALQPALPVFLGAALAELSEGPPVRSAAVGTVRVELPEAKVRDGAGALVPSRPVPGGTIFLATKPDVYTVRGRGATVIVAAGMADSERANINRSRFAAQTDGGARMRETGWQQKAPLGTIALLAVVVFLLLDWAGHVRRVFR
ncbi:MAG: hypothetical protein GC151_08450 [Betaproteobacteria bacterium]|nr:hypothetical protein [Betaproteobacteria bacterium]